MTARSHITENTKKQPVSTAPAGGMFQSRPFVMQPQTEEQSQQPPDLKTALQRAERYGHHLDRIASTEPPVAAQIPRIVQAKLTIGQPGDRYEQEADRVADRVVNQINAPAPQQSGESQAVQCEAMPYEDELQMKLALDTIQRETIPDEDEELQMKSSGAGMTAPQDLETSIQQARGSGQPLADSIKEPIEQAFGADFGSVKVHTDAQSDQLNQSIQAKAFTTGQDIFFRQGKYNPGSKDGQELIAHELTHVVQQNGGAVQRSIFNAPQPSSASASNGGMGLVQKMLQARNPQTQAVSKIQSKLSIGQPEDKYALEADKVASQVVEPIHAPVSAQSTQGQSVQRQEEPEEELQAKPSISVLQRSPLSIQSVAEYDHMVIDKSGVGLDALRQSLNENGLQTAQNRNIKLSEGSEKLGHHQHVFMWDKSKKGIEGSVGIEKRGETVRVKIRKKGLTEPSWYSRGNLKGDEMGSLGGSSTTGAWAYQGDIERKYLFIEGLDQVNQPGFDNWFKGDGWPEDRAQRVIGA